MSARVEEMLKLQAQFRQKLLEVPPPRAPFILLSQTLRKNVSLVIIYVES